MQLLQVEVQFSDAPMIQHINFYLGYKNLDRTFATTFQDESQLPTFRVANCDAIGENSRTGLMVYGSPNFIESPQEHHLYLHQISKAGAKSR